MTLHIESGFMKYQCTTTSDSMLDSFFDQAIRDPADASGVLVGVNPMMIVVRSTKYD